MAAILRSVQTIYGLGTTITALQAADATETAARIAGDTQLTNDLAAEVTRATGAETTLTTNLAAEVTRATAAEGVLTTDLLAEITRATAAEGVLTTNLATEVAARIAGDAALQTALDAEIARAQAAEASLISNVDPAALDSLSEVVAAFQAADADLNGAISTLADAAGADLDAEIARATAAEGVLTTNLAAEVTRATAAEGVLTTDLATEVAARIAGDSALQTALDAEIADRAADEAALQTAMEAYADEAARLGGSKTLLEAIVVASDKIVLTNKPKDGINSVLNYATVRYIDSVTMEVWDYPVITDATDAAGKTFTVSVDVSGQLDGKSVMVQYVYVAA